MKGMSWSWAVLLLLVGGSILLPGAAPAEPARGWYGNLGLGLSHLDQEESKEPKADLGFRLGAALGYRLDRNWGIELDSGLIRNHQPEDAHHEEAAVILVPVVLTGVYHFANASRFEPFLGAGFGLAMASYDDDTGGDATLGFKGGVRYLVDQRIAIGFDYTFFMLGVSSAMTGEAVGADTYNLGVRWAI